MSIFSFGFTVYQIPVRITFVEITAFNTIETRTKRVQPAFKMRFCKRLKRV